MLSRTAIFVCVTLSLSCGSKKSTEPSPAPTPSPCLADEYIIELKSGVVAESVLPMNTDVIYKYTEVFNGVHVRAKNTTINMLSENSSIEKIYHVKPVKMYGKQTPVTWGLDRLDQESLPLSTTFSWGYSGKNVDAYVVDTGIKINLSEFEGRAVWVGNTIDSNNTDCVGHGTHVAGTIGSKTYGVAKEVSLFGIKVLDCDGSGTDASVAAGIDLTIKHHKQRQGKPAVLNMSLGGEGQSAPIAKSIVAAFNNNITVVVAAGNDNADACGYSPAMVPEAITVAASTNTDSLAMFSNVGSCVDVIAPGVNILSTSIKAPWYEVMSGTSMASPHVAGVSALVLSKYPAYSPTAVSDFLKTNANKGKIRGNLGRTPNNLVSTLWNIPICMAIVGGCTN